MGTSARGWKMQKRSHVVKWGRGVAENEEESVNSAERFLLSPSCIPNDLQSRLCIPEQLSSAEDLNTSAQFKMHSLTSRKRNSSIMPDQMMTSRPFIRQSRSRLRHHRQRLFYMFPIFLLMAFFPSPHFASALTSNHLLGKHSDVDHSHSQVDLRIYSDLESGSVVHSFPAIKGVTRSIMPKSEVFFIANGDRDLVLSRPLKPEEAGRSFEFLVVENSVDSVSRYRVIKVKIGIMDVGDKVSFTRPSYVGKVPENRPAGTGVLLDNVPTLCALFPDRDIRQENLEYVLVPTKGGRSVADGVALIPIQDSDFELENDIEANCLQFEVLTTKMFDYEAQKELPMKIQAIDDLEEVLAEAELTVKILNENDNLPSFKEEFYDFEYLVPPVSKYPVVGTVTAQDADGDPVSYVSLDRDPCCLVVPQTGQIIAVKDVGNETILRVGVHEKDNPARIAPAPALIIIHRGTSGIFDEIDLLQRQKRRVTRAVRPTKRIEFTEADGEPEGKIVFQLEKESEHETFRIRDENPWVTVEPNGSVRVKKIWDYEELGREKTIDFWVIISNAGIGGKKLKLN